MKHNEDGCSHKEALSHILLHTVTPGTPKKWVVWMSFQWICWKRRTVPKNDVKTPLKKLWLWMWGQKRGSKMNPLKMTHASTNASKKGIQNKPPKNGTYFCHGAKQPRKEVQNRCHFWTAPGGFWCRKHRSVVKNTVKMARARVPENRDFQDSSNEAVQTSCEEGGQFGCSGGRSFWEILCRF